ncbi:MAG: beta-galactosidase, partial [Anaerolineaceae bacterium]|nr:beta-galactosidase [Anaerolineaceae bacterium]
MKTPFTLNNEPFFILGGQVHNSSGYGPQSMQTAWKALAALGANTAEVPVYWEQVEPLEGVITFEHLDGIIRGARERGLRLVLLWFATWKNGSMQYAPEWVKADPQRFPRVKTPGGTETWVLSSHFETTRKADETAYCKLLEHLRDFDRAENTVIGIQIENEPGILGSVRDYGAEAEASFQEAIPA